jgi:hypothetical protein
MKRIMIALIIILILIIKFFECNNDCCFNSQHAFIRKNILTLTNFDSLSELNFNCSLTIDLENLALRPNKPLILDNSLKFNKVPIRPTTELFCIILINFKGFEINSFPFNNANIFYRSENTFYYIQQSNLDFYTTNKLLDKNQCNRHLHVDFLITNVNLLIVEKSAKFTEKICPFLFQNAQMALLSIERISDSLVNKNRFSFLNVSIGNLNCSIFQLMLVVYHSDLNSALLNEHVFKKLTILNLNGVINNIQSDLFKKFQNIKALHIKTQNIKNVFVKNNKWMMYLNYELHTTPLALVVSQVLPNITYYDYPNTDICFFKDFPHKNRVLPYLKPFKMSQCSCTEIFLIKNTIYFRNFLAAYTDSGVGSSYFEYFYSDDYLQKVYLKSVNEKCLNSTLQETIEKCNFKKMLSNCNPAETSVSNGFYFYIYDWIELSKISNYVITNYVTLIFSVTAILTNLLSVAVLSSKFIEERMYKYLQIYSVFNLIFSCISILRYIVNSCEDDNFCSKSYESVYAQYSVIILVKLTGSLVQTCANLAHLSFTLARYVKVKAEVNKTLKKINDLPIKWYLTITIAFSLLINIYIIFEYSANDYEKYFRTDQVVNPRKDPLDYQKEEYSKLEYIILNILLYVKITISDLLSIIISSVIDLLLFSFVRKQNKKKKRLTPNPNVNMNKKDEASKRISQTIILNGINFILFRFPIAFIGFYGLVFHLSSETWTYEPSVASYLVCQTFRFCESVEKFLVNTFMFSFLIQFFIFYKLDKNFKASATNLKNRMIKWNLR